MNVEQCMTRSVVHCLPSDSLCEAARRMWEGDCGALVVLDKGGALVGMLTDRDVCMCGCFEGRPLREIVVERAMSRNVRVCRASDPAELALEVMGKYQVRRLPVLDESGRVVGVVASNDLIRSSNRTGEPSPQVTVRALALVCEPRSRRTERSGRETSRQLVAR